MGRRPHYYADETPITANSVSAQQAALRAYREDKPIKVKIHTGRFKDSIGLLASRYIAYRSASGISLKVGGFTIDFGTKKHRFVDDSSARYSLSCVTPSTPVRCKEVVPPKTPEFLLDRHGQELRPGNSVLIAFQETFAFGVVDRLTPKAIIIRNGKVRTRIESSKERLKGVVKLDAGVGSRFLMEKLARA